MLLYAGITSISFKYFNFRFKLVTKLKQRSRPAGNFAPSNLTSFIAQNIISFVKEGLNLVLKYSKSSSETLRNKTNTFVKQISIHVPTHLKPINDKDFGFYLAGIIDAAGNFLVENSNLQLVINFNELDASLAYFLKQKIGYGKVLKNKNKKTIMFVISKLQGIAKVINLINGKIRSKNKLNQIKNNVLTISYFSCVSFQPNINLDLNKEVTIPNSEEYLNKNSDLKNYWLCGFSDAISNFNITILNQTTCSINSLPEITLTFHLICKEKDLLLFIKSYLGGNISYDKNYDNYCYSAKALSSAYKIISYFDQYHLLSVKHVNYLKWRKAYVIIQNNEQFTVSGLNKIIKNQKSMNKLNNEMTV